MVSGLVERERKNRLTPLALIVLVAVVAVALHVRFADPLSSPVMATEDPYTHLVFTREHMDRGYFGDSYHMGTTLYPPGMHALLGIFWGIAGVDLYQFMRLGAPLWGGLAAAGMFLLAHRFGGVAAGGAAGLLTAFMPEHILRTNVFFPTAMDLALIPFMLLAFMMAADGHRAWLAPGALIALALTYAHPWVVPLTLVPVLAYLAANALIARYRDGRAHAWTDAGVTAVVGLALIALAMRTRWRQSQSGFGDFAGNTDTSTLTGFVGLVFHPFILAFALLAGGAVIFLARKGWTGTARGIAAAGVGLVLAVLIPSLTYSPPMFVDYGYQIGWLPAALAVAGVIVIPLWLRNRVALMGTALAGVTFPLTAVNIFQSPYLPHRTVAFLSVAIALLGAGFVAFLAHAGTRLLAARRADAAARAPPRMTGVRAGAAVLAVALLAAGLAGPGTAEPDEWYRYHTTAEYEGFRVAGEHLEANPRAVLIVGDWRPNMLGKAQAPDLDSVWFVEEYFHDPVYRENLHEDARTGGRPVYVLTDRYSGDKPGTNVDWLENGPYRVVWSCDCGTLTVYQWEGGR